MLKVKNKNKNIVVSYPYASEINLTIN